MGMQTGWALDTDLFLALWKEERGEELPQQVIYLHYGDEITGYRILEVQSLGFKWQMVENYCLQDGAWVEAEVLEKPFASPASDEPCSLDLAFLQRYSQEDLQRQCRLRCSAFKDAFSAWINPARELERKQALERKEKDLPRGARHEGSILNPVVVLPAEDSKPVPRHVSTPVYTELNEDYTPRNAARGVRVARRQDEKKRRIQYSEEKKTELRGEEHKLFLGKTMVINGEEVPMICRKEDTPPKQKKRQKPSSGCFRKHHNVPTPIFDERPSLETIYNTGVSESNTQARRPKPKKKKLKVKAVSRPRKRSFENRKKDREKREKRKEVRRNLYSKEHKWVKRETNDVRRLTNSFRHKMIKAIKNGDSDLAKEYKEEYLFWEKRLRLLANIFIPDKKVPQNNNLPVLYFEHTANGDYEVVAGDSHDHMFELEDALRNDALSKSLKVG